MAQAYRRLYKLERVCRAQVLAMSTGQPLEVLSDEIVAAGAGAGANDRHSRAERERLFFEAMMRILDRKMPGLAPGLSRREGSWSSRRSRVRCRSLAVIATRRMASAGSRRGVVSGGKPHSQLAARLAASAIGTALSDRAPEHLTQPGQ